MSALPSSPEAVPAEGLATPSAIRRRSPLKAAIWAIPIAALLVALPWAVDPYQTILVAYGLVMAIAVLGFNLLLGYTGLLSFGHSAYFGVGAYAVAFAVKYLHLESMELFLLAAIVASGVVTVVFGYACVRYTRIFFSILALALSQVLWSLAYKFFWVTGGTDGLRVPTPKLLGVGLAPGEDKIHFLTHGYYFYVLVVFALCVAAMWLVVHSPFGKALQAIRDNETRAQFVGIRIQAYRFVAFLISGIFTGIAGALWVPLNGLTTPEILNWQFSGEIVFMAVLGGFRNFTGPIVGAVAYNYLKDFAVGFTVYWQSVMGVVLVVLVLVLPTGIVGTAKVLAAAARKRFGR
jgi:branched-chain amino acid transport system permease protein